MVAPSASPCLMCLCLLQHKLFLGTQQLICQYLSLTTWSGPVFWHHPTSSLDPCLAQIPPASLPGCGENR